MISLILSSLLLVTTLSTIVPVSFNTVDDIDITITVSNIDPNIFATNHGVFQLYSNNNQVMPFMLRTFVEKYGKIYMYRGAWNSFMNDYETQNIRTKSYTFDPAVTYEINIKYQWGNTGSGMFNIYINGDFFYSYGNPLWDSSIQQYQDIKNFLMRMVCQQQ